MSVMQGFVPLLLAVVVAAFVFPGYVLVCRAYVRAGLQHMPTERAALGAVIAFVVLSVIALPVWWFGWSFPVLAGLYVAANAVLLCLVRGTPSLREAVVAVRRGIAREWLLIGAGVLLASVIVPFARLYGDGEDVLYFVGVVRHYMDAGHPSIANVIYGNGMPDGLNGVNLWLLFMSALGWAARADVLTLFSWAAGGLAIISLFAQRLLILAIADDDGAARVVAIVLSVALILCGGSMVHGINVDLMPNQAHRAAYPKVITCSVLVPLFMASLVRFIRSGRWSYVACLGCIALITAQIHPLEALWMGLVWAVLAVVSFWPLRCTREARGLALGLALLVVGAAPYSALYMPGARQLRADPYLVGADHVGRVGGMEQYLVGSVSTGFRVDPGYTAQILFPAAAAVLLMTVLGVDRKVVTVLTVAVLAPIVPGLFQSTAPTIAGFISLNNIVKLAISGSMLTPYLFAAGGALGLSLATHRSRLVERSAVAMILLACGLWFAVNHQRFSFDYKGALGFRDLFVEAQGRIPRAMATLPQPAVVFNGNQIFALRQVVALSDHYPYLLDDSKQVSPGLSPQEAVVRRAMWDNVMDPRQSPAQRYRILRQIGVRHLLVPKRAFSDAMSSPLFQWTAESEPGVEDEPYVFGHTRTQTEMRDLLNDDLRHLDEPATPFPAIAERLTKAIDLADTVNDAQALISSLGRFTARSSVEAYALLNIVQHQCQAGVVRARAADLAGSLDAVFESGGPQRLRVASFAREGSMSALRPEYHPDALADDDATTGIVMTGTHGAFSVTADLGTPALVDSIAVTTAFGNEHYSVPASTIYVSLDGHTWNGVGAVEALTGSGVVILPVHSIERFARYVRLAVPPAGNIAILEIAIEGRKTRPGVRWLW